MPVSFSFNLCELAEYRVWSKLSSLTILWCGGSIANREEAGQLGDALLPILLYTSVNLINNNGNKAI